MIFLPSLFNAKQCTVHNIICDPKKQFLYIIRGAADSTVHSSLGPKS